MFILPLELFLLLRYLDFCPDFFGHVEKWLDRKQRLISKFMLLQVGKQIITIRKLLPNTSRSRGN